MKLLDQNNQPYDEAGLQRHIEQALAVHRPGGALMGVSYPIIKRLFKPELLNTANIPAEPCLFIGNHSLFALDGMVLAPVMYFEQGRFLRGLGDKFLWNRYSEDFLLSQGAVLGHPAVCSALMEAGQDLMVFPGGAHEATKTAAQRYTLQWKERFGFVRMAAEHNYPIVPMALVGPDEFYDHWVEGEEIPDTPVGQLLTRLGILDDNTRKDLLPPIPLGLLGTLFPKPQHCYVQFGTPVRPAGRTGKRPTEKKLLAVRDEVAAQIESMLDELLALRSEEREEDSWLRQLLTR